MVVESEASSSLVQAYFGSRAKVDPTELFGHYGRQSDQTVPRPASGPSAIARPGSRGSHGRVQQPALWKVRSVALQNSTEKAVLRSEDTAKNACPNNRATQGSSINGCQIIPCAYGNVGDCDQRPSPPELTSIIDTCREVRPRRQVVSSAGASAKLEMDVKDMESQIRQMVECLKNNGAPLPGLLSLAVRKSQKDQAPDVPSENDTNKSCQCPSTLSHATTPSWRSRSFPPHFRRMDGDSVSSSSRATPEVARRQLPPLPDEATRRRTTPLSEVVRLTDISSEVHEANAMLVESFLNVKRRALAGLATPSEISYNSCSSAVERSRGSNTRDSSVPSSSRRLPRKARQPDMECLLEVGESRLGSEA